jgi:hypothetical protein
LFCALVQRHFAVAAAFAVSHGNQKYAPYWGSSCTTGLGVIFRAALMSAGACPEYQVKLLRHFR